MNIPNKNHITKIDGKYRTANWVRKHSLYPYPVFQATLMDQTIIRRSFWQKKGEPWDWEKIKRMIGTDRVFDIFIEHDGEIIR